MILEIGRAARQTIGQLFFPEATDLRGQVSVSQQGVHYRMPASQLV